MRARIRGTAVLLYTALSMVFFFLLSLPELVFLRTGHLAIWFARRAWGPSCLWVAGARVEVVRSARLPDGPLIFASNHESALDILALLSVLPRAVRFVAKQELFRVPVFGWYLAWGGHIPVDRGNHARALEALRKAGETIRAGTSLIVFPEGTRSRDGSVLPFKKGPFVVAMEAGVPVVPVAIWGSGRVTPKSAIVVHPGPIRIALGEPVDPHDHADKTALLVEVRRRVIELHRSMGGLGGGPDPLAGEAAFEGGGSRAPV
jgi:1-acyl-sn-glycerol-3-phosphate acyltransferase